VGGEQRAPWQVNLDLCLAAGEVTQGVGRQLGSNGNLAIVAKLLLHIVKGIMKWHSYATVKTEVSESFRKIRNI